jgi:hypothetical protein
MFCQEVVRIRKRHQPSIKPLANLGFYLAGAKRLRRNGLDGCERVFDPVVQLVDQKLAVLLGSAALRDFALGGVK